MYVLVSIITSRQEEGLEATKRSEHFIVVKNGTTKQISIKAVALTW